VQPDVRVRVYGMYSHAPRTCAQMSANLLPFGGTPGLYSVFNVVNIHMVHEDLAAHRTQFGSRRVGDSKILNILWLPCLDWTHSVASFHFAFLFASTRSHRQVAAWTTSRAEAHPARLMIFWR
jgi:hypothetical protein